MSSRWRKFAAQTATFDHALAQDWSFESWLWTLQDPWSPSKSLTRCQSSMGLKFPKSTRPFLLWSNISYQLQQEKDVLWLVGFWTLSIFGTYGVSLGFSLVETRPLAVQTPCHDPSPTYLTECVNNVLRICRSGTNTFGRRAAPPIDKHVYAKAIPTCFVFSSAILSVLHNCCHRILLAGCAFF